MLKVSSTPLVTDFVFLVDLCYKESNEVELNSDAGTEFKFLKNKVDALDKEKMTYAYTVIGGDALQDKVESISYEVKFEATPDGGCKGTNISKYNLKPGAEIGEEQLKEDKAKSLAILKAVEAYLLANPEA